jgi:uncharacterized damage-inducible protein DinB
MDTLDSLKILAGYNRWMNDKLYALCGTLTDAERKLDRKAFFGSIHGTLNHLLLADRGWLSRFRGQPWPYGSLDEILFPDFGEMHRERAATDQAIEEFVARLTEVRIAAPFTYQNLAGKTFTHPLGPALLQLFHHQTHHRGQVTTLLSQAGISPGVTDVIAFYREQVQPPVT